MVKLYLAHPFLSRQKARKWELMIEEKYGLELANPFYDKGGPGGREDIKSWDSGKKPAKGENYEFDLVQNDLAQIGTCEGVLAIVDGALSYGTIMEMAYANMLKKPVFLICTNGSEGHPWLVYHSKKIYKSFKEFENALDAWKKRADAARSVKEI